MIKLKTILESSYKKGNKINKKLQYVGIQQGYGKIKAFHILNIIDKNHPQYQSSISHNTAYKLGLLTKKEYEKLNKELE